MVNFISRFLERRGFSSEPDFRFFFHSVGLAWRYFVRQVVFYYRLCFWVRGRMF